MASSDLDLERIEVLWKRYKDRRARDPFFTIEAFAHEHSEAYDEILQIFPVLKDLESAAHHEPEIEALPHDIGGYPIVSCIGSGAMGVVYEARCKALRERIALKVLNSELLGPKYVQRFEQEARAVAALHHTHIVPIYDFCKDETQLFYTMRLVDGPNIADILQIAAFPADSKPPDQPADSRAYKLLSHLAGNWACIAELGAQAASAIAHAHGKSVLHRDIKPANLLIDATNKIWVTDFGLAKRNDRASDLTSIHQTVGTPRYMAPEQARGVSDHRSDIYSLGLTLRELACIDLDRQGLDARRLDARISPREINPGIPRELNGIIERATRPDPDQRYQRAEQLAHALEAFARKTQASKTTDYRWWTALLVIALLVSTALAWPLLAPNTRRLSTGLSANNPIPAPALVRLVEQLGDEPSHLIVDHHLLQREVRLSGVDIQHFQWDPDRAELRFRRAPDFEVPLDQDMDNRYQLLISRKGQPDQPLVIQIDNWNEPPEIDEFQFLDDQQTIHLSGEDLAGSWIMDINDDHSTIFDGLYFELGQTVDRDQVFMTPHGTFAFQPSAASTPGDANHDGIYDMQVVVSDETYVHSVCLEQQSSGALALVRESIGPGPVLNREIVSEDCLMRRDVIDLATADGQIFFHIHPNKQSPGIALYRSQLQPDGTLATVLLNADCGIPPEAVAIATYDGEHFCCVLRQRGRPRQTDLWQGTLRADGRMTMDGYVENCGLPSRIEALAGIDAERFYHIRTDFDGRSWFYISFLQKRFSNMPFDDRRPQYVSPVRGQAAWIRRADDSRTVSRQVRFDTNP